MFVRLGFAVAAHVDPDVLLIDEVLSVGDESFQRKCAEKIEEFRRDGRTIVFVSHGLEPGGAAVRARRLDRPRHLVEDRLGERHHHPVPRREPRRPAHDGELGTSWGSREAEITRAGFVDPDGATCRWSPRCSPP
jgi:ABC-2 type transport system ATP-binding protein